MIGFKHDDGWKTSSNDRIRVGKKEDFVYPVRINRGLHVKGKFVSHMTKSTHPFHSFTEEAWLQLLEVTSNVRTFYSQPERFNVVSEDGCFSYTPDTLVELVSGRRIYVEVKHENQVWSPNLIWKWPSIVRMIESQGDRFKLVTEKLVRHDQRHRNAIFLNLYRSAVIPQDAEMRVQMYLADVGAASLPEFRRKFGGGADMDCLIYALTYRRVLRVDLDRPFTSQTLFSRNTY